jgi:hypothetical protein
MKIMLNHSSATPHTIKSTKNRKPKSSATEHREIHANKSATNKTLNLNGRSKKTNKKSVPGAVATGSQVAKNTLTLNGTSKTIISNALKRRAQAVIKDKSIEAQSRALIRYGLETNDPLLAELVRRVDAGETIIETIVLLKHPIPTPKTPKGKRPKH